MLGAARRTAAGWKVGVGEDRRAAALSLPSTRAGGELAGGGGVAVLSISIRRGGVVSHTVTVAEAVAEAPCSLCVAVGDG